MIYTVIYEHSPNPEGKEAWSAYVPDLTGVVSGGVTREECERMIREAIELYVETMRDLGRPLPVPSSEGGVIEIANPDKLEPTALQTLNLKVPLEFKRSLKIYAAQQSMSMTDLLMEGYRLLREQRG